MNGNDINQNCAECINIEGLDFDFTFAFQPIINSAKRCITAYEALIRGAHGESAQNVLRQVNIANRYRFDQACRVKAVSTAVKLGLNCDLNINFYPNAVYSPELCIRTTLKAAETFGFPIKQIVFEVTEVERVEDTHHLINIIDCYRNLGFRTAIDDFGAGYAGLNLLTEYQPDYIKLDRQLIGNIDQQSAKQAIVRGIIQVCKELDIAILAEGIETKNEYAWLNGIGVNLFQGCYFARPKIENLPEVSTELYL